MAITSPAPPGTVASTSSRPEVRTGTPGNARPSSSAVRRAPVTEARSRRPPHSGQAYAAATRPHQRQAGVPCADGSASGPAQCGQRAGARQSAQATDGT